jgi:hypothetical protein
MDEVMKKVLRFNNDWKGRAAYEKQKLVENKLKENTKKTKS